MNHVEDICKRVIEIHLKKRADYTTKPDENPYENFDRANKIISWFPDEYKSFASHIGTKLARLGSLLQSGRTPNNESLDDSFLDLVTYCALAYGYYKSRPANQASKEILEVFGISAATKGLPVSKDIYESKKLELAGSFWKEPVSNRLTCEHSHLNLNRRCAICGDRVSWKAIHEKYQLDEARDCYRHIAFERK